MAQQLIKDETKLRGIVKSVETKGYKRLVSNYFDICLMTIRYNGSQLCLQIMNEQEKELKEIKDMFYKEMPEELSTLIENEYNKELIKEFREEILELKSDNYHMSMKIGSLYRQLFIQDHEIAKLKIGYSTSDFDVYKGEPDTCSICYDSILQNQHVKTCSTCGKCIHSQCFLYLNNKTTCPNCRSDSF